MAGVTVGSRNTCYRAARYALPGPVSHRLGCTSKAVPYGEVMEVMNLLRTAGYLKVALVSMEKVSGP